MNVRKWMCESKNMYSFSVASKLEKLEVFNDLLPKIWKNKLGTKKMYELWSHGPKNGHIFIIFCEFVSDDVLLS